MSILTSDSHPFLTRGNKLNYKNKEDLLFQCLTLTGRDEPDVNEQMRYTVHMYGVTKEGNSVHTKVDGFQPYCYVRPPPGFSQRHLPSFVGFIEKQLWKYSNELVDISLVTKTCLMGYQTPCPFVKCTFTTSKAMKRLKYIFLDSASSVDPETGDTRWYSLKKKIVIPGVNRSPFYFRLYEITIDPILRFIHNTGIRACGWIRVPKHCFSVETPLVSSARTQLSITTLMEHVHPHETDDIAPIQILSFDLECTSIDGGFPQASRSGDKIIQCGFTMHVVGKDNSVPFKYITTLSTCDPIDGVIVNSVNTEEELLEDICNVISYIDPDILTGYNINGFDYKYLHDRCKLYDLNILGQLSRLKSTPASLITKTLDSSALGNNILYILDMEGRVSIDLYKLFQGNFKLPSYKLDFVAKKYIGEEKHDVPPNKIFELQKGSSTDRSIIAKYCVQDCLLVSRLMDKLCFIPNSIAMANVCSVPLLFLFIRAQGIKGTSLVSRFCQEKNYVLPTRLKNKEFLKWKDMTEEERDEAKKYTGAVVLQAKKGFHYYPVVTNDFGSLYPSCIISHNISPDRRIVPESPIHEISESQKEHIQWEEEDGTKFHYVYLKADEEDPKWKKENKPDTLSPEEEKEWNSGFQHYQSNVRGGRGILPQIEMYLLASRKQAKKRKADAIKKGDSFMTGVYDGQQLAYKLCANSLYGLMGAATSDICCKPVAASITATGRQLLQFAIDVSKELYPESEVIYGDTDSVMVRYQLKDYDPNKKYISDDDKERLNIQAKECGIEVERVVSERLPYPHVLEMEKIFFPFILLSKKRYAAIQYDSDMRTHSKINYSGIVMTRRDNAPIVKKIFGKALDIIMFEHDIEKSVSYIQQECTRLLDGKYALEDLCISVTLKKVKKQKQAQHILAERIEERDPGNAPQLSDRVVYVFIKLKKDEERRILAKLNGYGGYGSLGGTSNSTFQVMMNAASSSSSSTVPSATKKPSIKKSIDVGYRIETPEYIREHPSIEIDYFHYLTNQLMKPICDLFKTVYDDPEKVIFKRILDDHYMRSNKLRKISDFFR